MLEGLLNVWQVLAQALLGASRGEAVVAQPVACRQAALTACCPSQHPKDTISSRSYTVHNNGKKVLVRKKVKFLSWENGPFVNVDMLRYCLHGVKHGKGKQCTHLCNTTRSKL